MGDGEANVNESIPNEKIEMIKLSNEDVIEQMRRNDPQVKGLQLSFYDSSPQADIQFRHINAHKVDWTKMGEFIANSTSQIIIYTRLVWAGKQKYGLGR